MSEDQKKQGGAEDLKKKLGVGGGAKIPGPLPGLGGKPSNAPLPGVGGQPAKAPLPGLGGQPSKAPLPGLGGQPSKAPLPGVGAQAAPVPPFMQQPEPEPQPRGPNPEQVARDPFGAPPAPSTTAVRPSYAPGQGLIGEADDPSVKFGEADAGKSKRPLIIGGVVIGLLALMMGYFFGTGKTGRVELNIAIRDARIIEWEIKETKRLFDEVQAVSSSALAKAQKMEYDTTHLAFLTQKVKGNPVKSTLFTERNYKKFDFAAVQWLVDYNQKWAKLDKLIQEHRRRTKNDEPMLKASKEEFQKLLKVQYGVVFGRDAKAGNQLSANIVVLGVGEEEGKVKVQADTGTFADERTIYNPEPGDGELTKEPEKYVIPLGEASKRGVLQNATQSHFKKYITRLKEISDLMKGMNELETNLRNKLSEISSQEPVAFGGMNVEDQFDEYVKNAKAGAGAAAAAAE